MNLISPNHHQPITQDSALPHSQSHSFAAATVSATNQNDLGSGRAFQVQNFSEGDFLFREGETPKGLYFVHSGCVKMISKRQKSRGRLPAPEFINKIVGAGDFFGFKALVKNSTYNFSAKAVKPSVVYIYPMEVISDFFKSSNPIVQSVFKQTIKDLEDYEAISQLHYLASVHERIAYQLALLTEKFGVVTPQGLSLNLKLTRNELAQMAGTINESLSRHLTELKNEGLVEIRGKEIIVKNLEALKKRSGNFIGV